MSILLQWRLRRAVVLVREVVSALWREAACARLLVAYVRTPCICFAAGLVHEAGIGAGNDVGMDLWGLAVLDGVLTCAVSRRSQMIYFVLAVSVLGQSAQDERCQTTARCAGI